MSTLESYSFLQPTFWSYNLDELDSDTHKTLIIKQILNHGDYASLIWLKATYTVLDISKVIENSMISEWSKKSLSMWSKIYTVTPQRISRFT